MIRLNPEALAQVKSAAGSGLGRGKVARLTVLAVSGKTVTISLNGLRLKAASDIPLQKGDVFLVKQQLAGEGLRLKILSRAEAPGTLSSSGPAALMEEDPALAKALISAGLGFGEERIARFRRRLRGKTGHERDEAARELALWEEKHSSFEGLGISVSRESGRKQDSSPGDSETGGDWRSARLDTGGIREFLIRRSVAHNSYQLFNHTQSSPKSHWLRLPFRVKLNQHAYRGELRLLLDLPRGSARQAAVKLTDERHEQDEWQFALDFEGPGRVDIVRAPTDVLQKRTDLTEKVRKAGFNLVDTLNRAFDGYTYQTESAVKGFDAEV